jgi:hypothetical protein
VAPTGVPGDSTARIRRPIRTRSRVRGLAARLALAAAVASARYALALSPAAARGNVGTRCPTVADWTPRASPSFPGYGDLEGRLPADWIRPTLERFYAVAAGPGGAVYAGGSSGLWRSADCGRSWVRVLAPLEWARAQGPRAFRTADDVESVAVGSDGALYVSGYHAMTSVDGGQTWMPGVPSVSSGALAVDPADAATVYLGYAGGAESTPTGCARLNGRRYVSHDSGATSTPVVAFPTLVTSLTFNPDGSRFWLATADGVLHRSRDRGTTWEPAAATSSASRPGRRTPAPWWP